MKNEIAKVKKNHPNLQPKEALKMAAANVSAPRFLAANQTRMCVVGHFLG